MGLLQLGHGLEFVTNHKKFAASSVSPDDIFNSSGLISATLPCQANHWSHPQGEWASPKHSLFLNILFRL